MGLIFNIVVDVAITSAIIHGMYLPRNPLTVVCLAAKELAECRIVNVQRAGFAS